MIEKKKCEFIMLLLLLEKEGTGNRKEGSQGNWSRQEGDVADCVMLRENNRSSVVSRNRLRTLFTKKKRTL